MTVDATSAICNLEILDSLSEDSVREIGESWNSFCLATEALLRGKGDLSLSSEFVSHAQTLCKHGLESLVQQQFLCTIEETFEKNGAMRFWQHFEPYGSVAAAHEINNDPLQKDEIQQVLHKALDEISSEKQYQEKCLWILVHALRCYKGSSSDGQTNTDTQNVPLLSKYQLMVSSVLMASLPRHFPEVLHWYFKGRLEDLSTIMEEDYEDDNELLAEDDMDLDEKGKLPFQGGDMDIDGQYRQRRFPDNNKLVKSIGIVVRDLRNLGLTSMTEDAYASAIFLLLKAKVEDLAGDDFRTSVLESIKGWIQVVPLQFLRALLAYLGDSTCFTFPSSGAKSPLASCPSSLYFETEAPSEGLVRWQLRLEYFAYETLQDLRIAKLFEIIVDYPDR